MIKRFRKRPVVVEAVQYTKDTCAELHEWLGYGHDVTDQPICGVGPIIIGTREGEMEASPGDWIIKGVKGEPYPCKPDIFALTYEEA